MKKLAKELTKVLEEKHKKDNFLNENFLIEGDEDEIDGFDYKEENKPHQDDVKLVKLRELLEKAKKEVDNKNLPEGIQKIKEYEIAFQDAIEQMCASSTAWWQVTHYWDIFDAFFFGGRNADDVIDEIINHADTSLLVMPKESKKESLKESILHLNKGPHKIKVTGIHYEPDIEEIRNHAFTFEEDKLKKEAEEQIKLLPTELIIEVPHLTELTTVNVDNLIWDKLFTLPECNDDIINYIIISGDYKVEDLNESSNKKESFKESVESKSMSLEEIKDLWKRFKETEDYKHIPSYLSHNFDLTLDYLKDANESNRYTLKDLESDMISSMESQVMNNPNSIDEESCRSEISNLINSLESFSNKDLKEDVNEDDHKTIRDNDCDEIALTEYEGGEPIGYTTSDKELEDWLKADEEHSWFPIDLNPNESLKEGYVKNCNGQTFVSIDGKNWEECSHEEYEEKKKGGYKEVECEEPIEESKELYVYAFPKGTTKKDIEVGEGSYNLQYLGQAKDLGGSDNFFLKGTKKDLEAFGDKYLGGYKLHPDFLWKEDEFDIPLEESNKSNIKKLKNLLKAETNEDYAIISIKIDSNLVDKVDTNSKEYEDALKEIENENNLKIEGKWENKPQPDSYFVKIELKKALALGKTLGQQEIIYVKFPTEDSVIAQVYNCLKGSKVYNESHKVILGPEGSEVEKSGSWSKVDDTYFQFGVYDAETQNDKFKQLKESKQGQEIVDIDINKNKKVKRELCRKLEQEFSAEELYGGGIEDIKDIKLIYKHIHNNDGSMYTEINTSFSILVSGDWDETDVSGKWITKPKWFKYSTLNDSDGEVPSYITYHTEEGDETEEQDCYSARRRYDIVKDVLDVGYELGYEDLTYFYLDESLKEDKTEIWDYDREEVEREYGLEPGELDGVDIDTAERDLGLEPGELDRFITCEEVDESKVEGTPTKNILKDRAKKHLKTQKKGAYNWKFHLTKEAGNPERNIEIFNHMMGSDTSGATSTADGGIGAVGMGEGFDDKRDNISLSQDVIDRVIERHNPSENASEDEINEIVLDVMDELDNSVEPYTKEWDKLYKSFEEAVKERLAHYHRDEEENINEDKKSKLSLKNVEKKSLMDYYKDVHDASEDEIRDMYGITDEDASVTFNYEADLYLGDEKICHLNYGNFDGMPLWAEIGVTDINNKYKDKITSINNFEEDTDLNEPGFMKYPDDSIIKFNDNGEVEQVLSKIVKFIESSITNLKEASSAFKKAVKNGGEDIGDYLDGKAISRVKDKKERDMLIAQKKLEKSGKIMSDRPEIKTALNKKVNQAGSNYEKKAFKYVAKKGDTLEEDDLEVKPEEKHLE